MYLPDWLYFVMENIVIFLILGLVLIASGLGYLLSKISKFFK